MFSSKAGAANLTGDVWQTPIASLGAAAISDLTVKGTEYWATGDDGVFKSTNLTAWTKVTTSGLTDALLTIKWTGMRFVATGLGVWTSDNGVAWTLRDSTYPFTPLGMAVKGNTVVAAGVGGEVLRSADGGLTWTRQNLGTQYTFYAVAATATHFVIVGETGIIFQSGDGATWVPRNSGTAATLYDVAFSSSRLVAVGSDATVLTSADNGSTWSEYNVPGGEGIDLAAVGGDSTTTVIGGARGLVLRTANPASVAVMQYIATPQNSSPMTSVARGATGWVMSGPGGTIMTSADGGTWTVRYPQFSVQYTSAVRTSSHFIAGGFPSDKFAVSTDGVTWSTVTTIIPAAENQAVTGMAWSPSPAKLVTGTTSGKIYSSTLANGTGLVQRTSGTTQRLGQGAWTGSLFIMPGNGGTILTSPNGDTWTPRSTGTTLDLTCAATSGTRHVVCGGDFNQGLILISTNGTTWDQAAAPNGILLWVAWNGSQFVAVGFGGLVMTSDNGYDWTEQFIEDGGIPFEETFTAVTWAGANWVAMTAEGSSVMSTDGVHWVVRPYAVSGLINSLVYGNSKVLAAGDAGLLLTSVATPPRVPVVRVPPLSITVDKDATAVLGFLAEGTPPLTYQWRKNGEPIFGSTDLVQSFPAASTLDNAAYDVVVTNAAGSVTSPVANLRVRAAPEITDFPGTDLYVLAGGSATLNVIATGAGPLSYQWSKTGTGALAGRTAAALSLTSLTNADTGEYFVQVSNEYGSTTSAKVRLFVTIPVAAALDIASPAEVQLTTGGSPEGSAWRGGTAYSHDGTDAAFSGSVPDGGSAWVEMTVSGMGAVSFWWDVSSESCCDGLRVTVNGTFVDQITGASQWRQKTVPLVAGGTSVVRWTYAKDTGSVDGQDRAWLDQVVFLPGPTLDLPVWAAETNLPANRRNPGDRNGPLLLENTLAYALGINPLTAKPADLPLLTRNGNTLTFQYTRTKRTTGTGYQVQWTTDPSSATWTNSDVSETVTGSTPARETVTATLTVPVNATRIFVRLKVSLGGT